MPNKASQIERVREEMATAGLAKMRERDRVREERAMANLAKIRKGDLVRLVDCFEAECSAGRLFFVLDEPREICGTWYLRLGEKGWFNVGCVELAEKGDPQ